MLLIGDSKLINAARSAVDDAAPRAKTFVENAMPAKFLQSMKASIRKLEDARQEQAKVKTARSLGRKALLESLRPALAASRRFDAIMRNTFRNDRINSKPGNTPAAPPRPTHETQGGARYSRTVRKRVSGWPSLATRG